MRPRIASVLLLVLAAAPVAAQSSQFGVRGLGIPLRPLSVRSAGSAGATGLFDPESGVNPAAIGLVSFTMASFQTVQSWRRSTSPTGTVSGKDNRYPGIFVTGHVGGTPVSLSLSASGYTDRNFSIATSDTLIIRGEEVTTIDTLRSLGGVSDVRGGFGWRVSNRLQLGLGVHMLTGSNRILSTRRFSDTTYAGAAEQFTISYLGAGVSAGIMARVGRSLTLAGTIRADHKLRLERDSAKIGTIKLPMTLSGGARLQVGNQLILAGAATYRTWSASDDDIVEQGGVGSINTTEFQAGLEYFRDGDRPSNLPIRLGFFHARLPFPLQSGDNTSETGITFGTSKRFVADRAGFDLALSQIWRRGGEGFTERATQFTFGISVRP